MKQKLFAVDSLKLPTSHFHTTVMELPVSYRIYLGILTNFIPKNSINSTIC